MNWALFAIAGFLAFSAFVTIAMIGKPRQPTTPTTAAVIVFCNTLIVVVMVLAAIRLT